jgi:hypothetical protein
VSHTTELFDDVGRRWLIHHNSDWSGDATVLRLRPDDKDARSPPAEEYEIPASLFRDACRKWVAREVVEGLDKALESLRGPFSKEQDSQRWGVWCVDESTWCPSFEPPFSGTELEARREVEHWRSGERANVPAGRFRYEARPFDAAAVVQPQRVGA